MTLLKGLFNKMNHFQKRKEESRTKRAHIKQAKKNIDTIEKSLNVAGGKNQKSLLKSLRDAKLEHFKLKRNKGSKHYKFVPVPAKSVPFTEKQMKAI